MKLAEQVKAAGVVGAGGGGSSPHVMLAAQANTVIANDAEWKPLLPKDAAVAQHRTADLVRGMKVMLADVGHGDGASPLRRRRRRPMVCRSPSKAARCGCNCSGTITLQTTRYDLPYTITVQLILSAGIPINARVVVNTVETLVERACRHRGAAGHPEDRHPGRGLEPAVPLPNRVRIGLTTALSRA